MQNPNASVPLTLKAHTLGTIKMVTYKTSIYARFNHFIDNVESKRPKSNILGVTESILNDLELLSRTNSSAQLMKNVAPAIPLNQQLLNVET